MAGFLSRIFGGGTARTSGPGSSEPLFAALRQLDSWEKGLTARAVTYVRDCDGRPVLSAIASRRPPHTTRSNQDWDLQLKQQENAVAMIHHFGNRPGPLARYSEVVSAMIGLKPNRGRWNKGLSDETPDEVANLLTILVMPPPYAGGKQMQRPKPQTPIAFNDLLEAVDTLGGCPADLISLTYAGGYSRVNMTIDGKMLADHVLSLPVAHFVKALNRLDSTDKAMMLKSLENKPVAKDPGMLDFLIEAAGMNAAKLRTQATGMLANQNPAEVEARMIPLLSKGSVASRSGAVQALGAIGSETAIAAMKDRLGDEKSQEIIAAINFYLGGNEAVALDVPKGSYQAHDGTIIALPVPAPVVDDGKPVFDDTDLQELRALDAKRDAQNEEWYENTLANYNKQTGANKANWSKPKKPIKVNDGAELFNLLNAPITLSVFDRLSPDVSNGRRRVFPSTYHLGQWLNTALPRLPDARLIRAALQLSASVANAVAQRYSPFQTELITRLEDGRIDMRHVLVAAKELKIPLSNGWNIRPDEFPATVAGYMKLQSEKGASYGGVRLFKSSWPLTVAHLPDVMAMLPPQGTNVNGNLRGLEMLAHVPKLPAAAVDAVLFAALDPRRSISEIAQKILVDVDGIDQRVIETLTDNRQAVRAKAASFLADRDVKKAVPAIVKRLKTEKSETARADMISAVAQLGGDTAPYLGKAALMKEAEGFVAKLPNAKLDWLNLETMPPLVWADGKPVDPMIPDAWLRLALKLKDPKGSPLFGLYFDQLQPASVTAFCDWVLRSWIAHDIWRPAVEPLRQKAQKQAEAEKAAGQSWMAKNWTVDQIAAQYLSYWTSSYPNSGSDAKGILGLTHRAKATTATAAIGSYLKQHGKRVSQAKSLVEVLTAMGTPEALQVLVATATRFKQRSVRELAEVCVSDIAEARGWTEDELADRSVPSGGFEEDGIMQLEVGEEAKPYTARLGSDLSVKLFNPDGKEVKAVPAGKDENTKESKALLATAKKTVKTVTGQQTTRLYDAMVGGRVWPLSDWEVDILSHPILSRLVERVIWRGLDGDGKVITLFRPTPEGDRMTADGDDADLSNVVCVDIAHTATVAEDVRQAWLTHMDDFEVKPLFAQISRPMQVLDDKQKKETAITDREGWLTEAFKLRGAAGKANYDRGPVEDGAGFSCYVKSFRTAGIRAELNFTGSYVPEENIPVAIINMEFRKDTKTYYGQALPLAEVPGMVLSEAWNDLYDIASTGAFDADWRKKGLY